MDNQHDWLKSSLGEYLRTQEQSLFDGVVGDVFGFNAVQLGMLQMDLLRTSRIHFLLKADINSGEVQCDSMQLPFQTNTIDLLLLPHTLDFSQNPQQTLREAERVLVPEGHIMIAGFNPMSIWGLKRMMTKRDAYPWNGNYISLLRIKDWLTLLGFELVEIHMACHMPPCGNTKWLQRFRFMDKVDDRWWLMMGGVYFIVAKKKVLGMRLIRPNWNHAKFNPGLIVTPSQKDNSQ